MVNILLEGYGIDAPWLCGELSKYLKPRQRVAVIALSFRDSRVSSADEWDALYGKGRGRYYVGIVKGLSAYGISEDDISFINYFTDTPAAARKKIEDSDAIYFLGGLPDRMMERIDELGLIDTLRKYDRLVIGYSAGALIQLDEYHLSPDHDYPVFGYYKGLSYLDGFYLEVHYEGTEAQDESIRRVLSERKRTVLATSFMKGAIVVDNGKIKTLGDVKVFESPKKM